MKTRSLFGRLWSGYLSRHKPRIAVAAVLMLTEGAALGLFSWMLQPMFDRVFVGGDVGALGWIGGVIFGLFLFRGVAVVVQRWLLTQVSQRSIADLQTDLLRHLMTLDAAWFERHPPGSVMERVVGDALAIQNVWKSFLLGGARDAVALASLMAVAISIDPLWTAVALVGVPVLILPMLVLQRYVRKKTRALRATAGERTVRLSEVLNGLDTVRLEGMEEYQAGRFRALADRIVRTETRVATGQALIPGMVDVVTGIGFVAVLATGGAAVASGDKTVGQFMAFFTAMAMAFQPLRKLGGLAGLWQQANASLERLFELLDARPSITSPALPKAPPAEAPDIVFEDVHLSYGETEVLRGASLTAPAGRTTALVGPSGAGKSTLFHLLTRRTVPDAGRVLVGDTDISEMGLAELRRSISVVAQDTLLFDETLRENLLLGRDPDESAVTAALEAAQVPEFLPRLPLGLDSPAGLRGGNLSGGQRQRIAIARALLKGAPILLLDEATSALDTRSEALVQDALDRLSVGRTTLVIAHRLSTVRDADRIVLMEAGRVAETGTHDELLARGGAYAALWRMQFREEAAAGQAASAGRG
ncbi:ATP-binding cassette subfamily B protein [Hasllibacter halocynthiae]|uniref:ATP-binding cassette subfamily B protein n=1 Tax=Hasllibacter halocynthiae TaxID=595589 RepID=A0A2T0X668_9RHOB|nr:ABC transporter ATP-binding protein [Hasllibacter halocynthiae]PRY94451.1 ATP-binding cassette subfamily B protein [Hasllibacter halocynthiae]